MQVIRKNNNFFLSPLCSFLPNLFVAKFVNISEKVSIFEKHTITVLSILT